MEHEYQEMVDRIEKKDSELQQIYAERVSAKEYLQKALTGIKQVEELLSRSQAEIKYLKTVIRIAANWV